jgi:hypothetical protein
VRKQSARQPIRGRTTATQAPAYALVFASTGGDACWQQRCCWSSIVPHEGVLQLLRCVSDHTATLALVLEHFSPCCWRVQKCEMLPLSAVMVQSHHSSWQEVPYLHHWNDTAVLTERDHSLLPPCCKQNTRSACMGVGLAQPLSGQRRLLEACPGNAVRRGNNCLSCDSIKQGTVSLACACVASGFYRQAHELGMCHCKTLEQRTATAQYKSGSTPVWYVDRWQLSLKTQGFLLVQHAMPPHILSDLTGT